MRKLILAVLLLGISTVQAGTQAWQVDLATGNEVGRVPMADKEPQFLVDAIGNRVYYFRDKTELLAYDF